MTEPLRVAMYADAYQDYVQALTPALAEVCALRLFHPAGWGPLPDSAAGTSVEAVPMLLPRVRQTRRLATVARAIRAGNAATVDLFHIQQSGDPWFSLAMHSHGLSTPTVVTVHDASPHPGDGSHILGSSALQRTWRRRVDHFIVHAAEVGNDLADHWHVPSSRITLVDHVELGSLYRARAAPDRIAPEREPATVLFYGRRWAYKGLSVLIDALTRMAGALPGLRLIVAGQGDPLEPMLGRLPKSVDVECHDRRIDDKTTLQLFDRASVVCLPYVEVSQSGVAALAIGLGTPIVASSIGGLPRLVRDGKEGRLVRPGDADALAAGLLEVLGNPALQQSMRTASLARASSDLSACTIAKLTEQVYRRVAG